MLLKKLLKRKQQLVELMEKDTTLQYVEENHIEHKKKETREGLKKKEIREEIENTNSIKININIIGIFILNEFYLAD